MKTKTTLQRTALTLGLSFTAAASLQAQVDGSNGVILGGDSTLGRITAAETITDISDYGVGVFPQGWRTPFLDIANIIAPVSQFTGVNNDGTNVATLDLIPLRTTSLQLVNPVTNVITAVDGKNLYNSNGTLSGNRVVSQSGNDLSFAGGNVSFAPTGVTNPLFVWPGATAGGPRIISNGGIELQSTTNGYQVYLSTNGNVGIGTGSPTQAKLAIIGTSAGGIGYAAGNYFVANNLGVYGTTSIGAAGPLVPSVYANGDIVSSGAIRANLLNAINITVSSDERIKSILGLSDSSKDLATINEIRITDYDLKDKTLQKSGVIKKVVAQQVEAVYPSAVSRTCDRIPDIMEISTAGNVASGKVDFSLTNLHGLKVGEKISVLDENNVQNVTTIEKIEKNIVTVALPDVKLGDKRFIYGRQVDDFRVVDYDAISMLNVSATQELAKKVSVLEAENAELKKLSAKVDQMAALIAALEGKSDAKVTVSLTK